MLLKVLEFFLISAMFILLVWLPCWFDLDGENIWITRNREINWFFTHFLPVHATVYKHLCERLNGRGLAIILIGISLLTLPATIPMFIIGMTVLCIRWAWRWFCNAFRREKERGDLDI